MKAVYCPYCGGRTKRNGRTSSGSQRWRCTACGASTTLRYDDTAARLEEFLGWLLSKDSQATMPGGGRSFRRRTAEFWEVWPMPVPDGELHRVLYVDGIWVARDLVVLICCSGERVVSWYMARSENSRAWSALMAPIPAPEVVVTDGGSGFAKAVRETWPRTRVQRCTFHAFSQVKRYTTTRPKLQAGRELYLIARDLMGIETLHQAELWVERYLDWCGFWADFLEDRTVVDGRRVYTHERLRRGQGDTRPRHLPRMGPLPRGRGHQGPRRRLRRGDRAPGDRQAAAARLPRKAGVCLRRHHARRQPEEVLDLRLPEVARQGQA